MKRYLIILFWICLTITVSAQIEKSPHMFFSNVLVHEYAGLSDGTLFSENTRGWGIEAGYMYQKDNLRFAIPIRTSVYKVTDEFVKTSSAAADLQIHYLFGTDPFKPYLGAGVSVNNEFDVGTHVQIPLIAGINYYVNDVAAINFHVQYRLGLEDDRTNLQLGLGFVRHFGATGEKQMIEEVKTMDVDGDGITDDLDLCPNVPGLASFNGCPDKDGDGIPDYKDNCPEFPGAIEMGGCPDSDGDGISDNDDQCPKLPGLKADNGCPKSDMDNDGVADNLDRCPRVAGPANTGGCPDTDKDGIPNIDDNCPSIYGPASTNGCPDSDGDGVDDSRDLCPKSYGPASNSGCPEITKEDKELLAFAVENVEFEHNSSYLTVDSKPILDEIANIMRRYPDYNLMISGHTDNTGSTVYNQEMSEKRARTCYLYLMEKGISQNKLSHTGYGETKPIADNETLMGRSKNRRVEFELYPGGRR